MGKNNGDSSDRMMHDKGHGTPNLTRKVWGWLHKNGWCQNGLKK